MQLFNKINESTGRYISLSWLKQKCVCFIHLKRCHTFKIFSTVLFLIYPTCYLWCNVISILWLHFLHICVMWVVTGMFCPHSEVLPSSRTWSQHHLMSLNFSCLFTASRKAEQYNIISVMKSIHYITRKGRFACYMSTIMKMHWGDPV